MKYASNISKSMTSFKFAVFILTHGRPDNVKTLATLQKCGYTGKIYFIVDNEDKTVDKYRQNFGSESVKVFDKKAIADTVDEGNNFDERRTITHARNASFDIAEDLGLTHFLQLDDDYTSFDYRLIIENEKCVKPVKNLDNILNLMIQYFESANFTSIAFAQGGDYIGGIDNGKGVYRFSKRKCMNTFFCSTSRRFQFIGAMNEDVNTYTSKGGRGDLFLTVPFVSITQTATQSNKSGITDMYLRFGTYCKAFTTVMMQPSNVRVSMMNSKHQRIHHSIDWAVTVPKIINHKHKKPCQ